MGCRSSDLRFFRNYGGSKEPPRNNNNAPRSGGGSDFEHQLTAREIIIQEVCAIATGPQGANLDWLNWSLTQFWPHVAIAGQKFVKEHLEPQIQARLPSYLKSIHFEEFHLGHHPPKLGPVNVRKDLQNGYEGIDMDIAVEWVCDANFVLESHHLRVGMSNVTLKGEVQVNFRPIMDQLPILGGVQVTMMSPPSLHWNFKGLLTGLSWPVVSGILRRVVADALADILVIPNQIFLHWCDGHEAAIDLETLQFPHPEAVVRLCVKEARNLQGKDWSLLQAKQTSDPYVVVRIGHRSHNTPVINKTTDPVWDDDGWFDFFLYSPMQLAEVDVYDSDIMLGTTDVSSEYLGGLPGLTLGDILREPDRFWDLKPRPLSSLDGEATGDGGEAPNLGQIRLVAEFLRLVPHLPREIPRAVGCANATMFAFVMIRSLRGLVVDKASGARIILRLEREELVSKASRYRGVSEDLVISAATRKLVEYLYNAGKSIDEIVAICGLTRTQVSAAVFSRPSFTTRWHQMVTIPVRDAATAVLEVGLQLQNKTRVASSRVTVAEVMRHKGWVFENILELTPESTVTTSFQKEAGALELDLRIILRAVCADGEGYDFAEGTRNRRSGCYSL